MSAAVWQLRRPHLAIAVSLTALGGCNHNWDKYSPEGSSTGSGSGAHGGGENTSSTGAGGSGVGGGAPLLPYDEEVLADDPVVYLRFGERSGPTAHDEMGNFDGTYPTSAITYGAPGALAGDENTAIMLNHQTPPTEVRGIAMPPGLDFAGTVPFTIELWASQTSSDGYGFAVDHEDWNQLRAGWVMMLSYDGVSLERWDNDTTSGSAAKSTAPLSFDGYHHVVGVSEASQLRLYIDGELQSANGVITALQSTGTPWTIGKQNCGCDGNAFAGSLDEFAVYDKALSEDRILVHYRAGSGK